MAFPHIKSFETSGSNYPPGISRGAPPSVFSEENEAVVAALLAENSTAERPGKSSHLGFSGLHPPWLPSLQLT